MKYAGLIIGGIIVVAIIAGAAFMAGQMLSTPEQAEASSQESGRVMQIMAEDGDGGAYGVEVTFEPSAELPDRESETSGLFTRREDNSFFVGTGNIEVMVEVDDTGERSVTADHSGPEVEVVVGHDTLIYEDVTEMNVEPSAQQSGSVTIQQVVQPADSLETIVENVELQVWGERRGDRIIAEVVVYRQPNF